MERTPLLTLVTPVSGYHRQIVQRAIDSVKAQTIPCEHIIVYDDEAKGAGWARNVGLAQVNTEFTAFLDADDELLPEFAARTIAAWKPRRFVFVNWLDDELVVQAAKCPWTADTRNIITSLLHTTDARSVGGFDEDLKGMEDTSYFLKLLSAGICGLHVPEPLFRYGKDGQRSKAFYRTDAYFAAVERFNREFGRRPTMACGGCGSGNSDYQALPVGERLDADVLAIALWSGNRIERGRSTGRLYPRAGNGAQLWVDPRDVDAAPQLFARVIDMPAAVEPTPASGLNPDFAQLTTYLGQRMNGAAVPAKPVMPAPVYAAPAQGKPDVGKLLRLYQNS